MAVSKIAQQAEGLTDDDFQGLIVRLMEQRRPPEVMKAIKTKVIKTANRAGRSLGPKEKEPEGEGVSEECYTKEWPDPQAPGSSREVSRTAFKSPMIFRGDLIPHEGFVYFDVEKLTLQIPPGATKHEQVASSVAVVNRERNIVLWAFINWSNICQTFPTLTGINKEKLKIGLDIEIVKPFVLMSFAGNTLGWDLHHDLVALFVSDAVRTLDLTDYYRDDRGKMKLKDCWEALCKKDETDSIQCGIHTAIQDSRATRDLHLKMEELKREYPSALTCPIPIPRSARAPFTFDKNDVCKCKKNKTQKTKQLHFWVPE